MWEIYNFHFPIKLILSIICISHANYYEYNDGLLDGVLK